MEILYILPPIVFAIIAGCLASKKNRSLFGWFILTFFFPIALIVLAFLSKLPQQGDNMGFHDNNPKDSICPQCAETIKKEAKICRYCKLDLVEYRRHKPVQVEPNHQNMSPSNLLATAYYFEKNHDLTKALAYYKLIAEKYPNTEECKISLSQLNIKCKKCSMCAEFVDSEKDICYYCEHPLS